MHFENAPLTSLYEILTQLLGLHRQLLDNVRAERDALVAADLKRIQEATALKEGLIQAIRAKETERLAQTGELAREWKMPLTELTLPKIAIAIQGRDSKTADLLRSSHQALTLLIGRIGDQSRYNRSLVEKSLEHIQNMKRNVLGESVPKSNTYSPSGQAVNNASGARLVSKEV